MPSQEEKDQIIIHEINELRFQVSALRDLSAMLMAELASIAPNPSERLHQMIEGERNAVYSAATSRDNETPMVERLLLVQAEIKNGAFKLAQQILVRIQTKRK